MTDQIDSSSKTVQDPKPQPLTANWSQMTLLSIQLSDLMKEIVAAGSVDQSLQNEDLAYISNALEQCKMAKQFEVGNQLEMAIFHSRKASKIID